MRICTGERALKHAGKDVPSCHTRHRKDSVAPSSERRCCGGASCCDGNEVVDQRGSVCAGRKRLCNDWPLARKQLRMLVRKALSLQAT